MLGIPSVFFSLALASLQEKNDPSTYFSEEKSVSREINQSIPGLIWKQNILFSHCQAASLEGINHKFSVMSMSFAGVCSTNSSSSSWDATLSQSTAANILLFHPFITTQKLLRSYDIAWLQLNTGEENILANTTHRRLILLHLLFLVPIKSNGSSFHLHVKWTLQLRI
jgi:hypothetical protein